MARTCNCTGYLNNPGGVCCKDVQPPTWPSFATAPGTYSWTPNPLTEEQLRRIIREELDKGKK